jgi:hypothetical protein
MINNTKLLEIHFNWKQYQLDLDNHSICSDDDNLLLDPINDEDDFWEQIFYQIEDLDILTELDLDELAQIETEDFRKLFDWKTK